MAKCKTKAFQTDLGIIRHIQNLVWVCGQKSKIMSQGCKGL